MIIIHRSVAALEKATRSMLKACGESKVSRQSPLRHDDALSLLLFHTQNQHGHPAASKDADEKQVAMLLSKA